MPPYPCCCLVSRLRASTHPRIGTLVVALVAVVALAACQPAGEAGQEEAAPEPTAATEAASEAASDAAGAADADRIVFEVTATEHAFTAPPRIPSGWTNVVLRNDGEETHFLVLWRLPESVDFATYTAEVVTPFTEAVERYDAGETDREEMMAELGAALPEWFNPIAMGRGGAGLTSPGHTTRTWVRLEPGEYVMECYVRSPENDFHGNLGMLRPLIVSEEDSGLTPPEADARITLSNHKIAVDGDLTAGERVVAVEVAENPEGLLGHDLHLVRMEDDTDLDELAAWMDWVDAMRSPAPAEFVAGAEQVPAGHTSYLTVDLEPGRYAWISEGYAQQGMVQEFTVD